MERCICYDKGVSGCGPLTHIFRYQACHPTQGYFMKNLTQENHKHCEPLEISAGTGTSG